VTVDWAATYRVAPDLVLQVGDGQLIAASGGGAQAMPVDVVAVLCAFGRPVTLDAAFAELSAKYELDREGLEAVVGELVAAGALVVVGGGVAAAAAAGWPLLEAQFQIVRDARRVGAYQAAIERAAPGKTVAVLGGAPGVLATLAARAGARRVYAIEPGPIADLAAEVLAANGGTDRVQIVRDDTRAAALGEQVEVLVHDLVVADPIADRALEIVDEARGRLAIPGARVIPYAVDLSFVGVDLPRPDDLVDETAAIEEVAALIGVDLAPFAARVRRARGKARVSGGGPVPPRAVLTDEVPYLSIDLRTNVAPQLRPDPIDINLAVHTRGRIAGVAALFRLRLDERTAVGNHPWLPGSSWSPVWHGFPRSSVMPVLPNDRIAVKARIARDGATARVAVELG
jgi:protein arginine N-methyltransferase 1